MAVEAGRLAIIQRLLISKHSNERNAINKAATQLEKTGEKLYQQGIFALAGFDMSSNFMPVHLLISSFGDRLKSFGLAHNIVFAVSMAEKIETFEKEVSTRRVFQERIDQQTLRTAEKGVVSLPFVRAIMLSAMQKIQAEQAVNPQPFFFPDNLEVIVRMYKETGIFVSEDYAWVLYEEINTDEHDEKLVLTPRQQQVYDLLAMRASFKEVAQILDITQFRAALIFREIREARETQFSPIRRKMALYSFLQQPAEIPPEEFLFEPYEHKIVNAFGILSDPHKPVILDEPPMQPPLMERVFTNIKKKILSAGISEEEFIHHFPNYQLAQEGNELGLSVGAYQTYHAYSEGRKVDYYVGKHYLSDIKTALSKHENLEGWELYKKYYWLRRLY